MHIEVGYNNTITHLFHKQTKLKFANINADALWNLAEKSTNGDEE